MAGERRTAMLRAFLRPAALPLLAALVLFLVAPWGEYPLNDDWQYARVAKRFAETGELVVDVAVAPSLVTQSVAVAPLVRVAGFSHVALRMATYSVALVAVWAVGRLLALAGVAFGVRLLAQALVLLNPLFLNVALSFMSEVWGFAPALLGATVWFSERRRVLSGGEAEGDALRPRVVVAAALLVALGVWSRQHAAVVFPALVASLLLSRPRPGEGSRAASARSLLAPLAPGLLVFCVLVAAQPLWARATGNLRPEFAGPFASLLQWNAVAWFNGLAAQPYYQTAFVLPLLALVPWRGLPRGRAAAAALLLVGAAGLGALGFATLEAPDFAAFVYQRRVFPFLPNVLYNAGVGPVTLPEVFFDGQPPPRSAAAPWIALQVLLGLATALWAPLVVSRRKASEEGSELRGEIARFGAFWAAASLALALQAHQVQLFDRYLLPVTVGLVLAVATRAAGAPAPRLAAAVVLLAPLGLFAVAGMHDYFRWNDARWSAVRALLARGVSPTVVQGGWEVNGWLAFDHYRSGQPPEGCIGDCACSVTRPDWNCLDDSYRIAMHPLPGYEVLEARPVRGWLAPCPPILTLRRAPAARAGHGATGGEGSARTTQSRARS